MDGHSPQLRPPGSSAAGFFMSINQWAAKGIGWATLRERTKPP
jgi:hypothetical protein